MLNSKVANLKILSLQIFCVVQKPRLFVHRFRLDGHHHVGDVKSVLGKAGGAEPIVVTGFKVNKKHVMHAIIGCIDQTGLGVSLTSVRPAGGRNGIWIRAGRYLT